MCFHYAYIADTIKTGNRFGVAKPPKFEPVFHANAFSNLAMPVITNENKDEVQFYNWGLIPAWVKTAKDAQDINKKTANARSETVFEKPSFRSAIKKKRCLVPANGFYEWRHEGKEKIPHFVYLKNQDIFSFAGIFENWTNKETGEIINTYSILTAPANELMSYVHNNRERMPVILRKEDEEYWLSDLKNEDEICKVYNQITSEEMQYQVIDSKDLWQWGEENISKLIQL